MNYVRLALAVAVGSIAVWATDFLIHAVWLGPVYAATQELWRTEPEMVKRLPYMFLGQFLVGASFAWAMAAFVADKRDLGMSVAFGVAIGLLIGGGNVIMYAVQPLPGHLVFKWFAAYVIQMALIAALLHFVYRPLAPTKSS